MYERPELSKKAWELRENGDSITALALWLKLEREAEEKENWPEAIVCLTDMAITLRNLGKEKQNPLFFDSALGELNHAKFLSEIHNIPPLPDFDYQMGETFSAAGKYEEAIISLEKYLQNKSLTPEIIANTKAKIGYCLIKSGKKEEGIKLLEESIQSLENPTEEFVFENKDVVAIWKTGAKLNLAEVLDDKNRAKQLIEEVLAEAQEKNLGARTKEAQRLLEKLE